MDWLTAVAYFWNAVNLGVLAWLVVHTARCQRCKDGWKRDLRWMTRR